MTSGETRAAKAGQGRGNQNRDYQILFPRIDYNIIITFFPRGELLGILGGGGGGGVPPGSPNPEPLSDQASEIHTRFQT